MRVETSYCREKNNKKKSLTLHAPAKYKICFDLKKCSWSFHMVRSGTSKNSFQFLKTNWEQYSSGKLNEVNKKRCLPVLITAEV